MFSYLGYRIPVSETDLMGIVHHSYYTRYFERGRVEYLRQIGINYRDLSDEGLHFPVLRTECQHRRPLKFDDWLAVESVVQEVSKTRLCFLYRVLRFEKEPKAFFAENSLSGEFELSATGFSEHCCLAPDGKPQRIPESLLKKLSKFTVPRAEDHDHYKIKSRNRINA